MVSKRHRYIEHAVKRLIPPHLDHVLEFGVAAGKSMRIITSELDKKKKKYEIFGFDSFLGLQEDWITPDGDVLLKKGTFSTNRKPPDMAGVTWFVGWFEETIPEYLKIAKNVALLHVDCDQYKPAKEIFYGLQNFIVKGTIIAIDDWFYENNPRYNDTTQKAFYEWIVDFAYSYKFHDYPGSDNGTVGKRIVEIL